MYIFEIFMLGKKFTAIETQISIQTYKYFHMIIREIITQTIDY